MMMQVDEGIAIYQVGCFILLLTYLFFDEGMQYTRQVASFSFLLTFLLMKVLQYTRQVASFSFLPTFSWMKVCNILGRLLHSPSYLLFVDEGIAIYQVGCFIFLPTYLFTRPCNFMIVKNNVAMIQLKVLQLNQLSFMQPYKTQQLNHI